MPVVGSSSSSRAGSDSSAIANRSRCCSPPEHLPTLRSAMRLDAGRPQDLVDRARVGEEARGVRHGLADREVLEQAAGLHHRGDEAAGDRLARLEAEHLDRAGRGLREPEDHVDGRGLAGAVGAEEGDDLALLEGQVDAADGVDGAEVLGDPGDLDGGHGARRWRRAFPERLVCVMAPAWRTRRPDALTQASRLGRDICHRGGPILRSLVLPAAVVGGDQQVAVRRAAVTARSRPNVAQRAGGTRTHRRCPVGRTSGTAPARP